MFGITCEIDEINSTYCTEKQALQSSTNLQYRCPSLYTRDRDQKNKLAYNKFAYKRPRMTVN